MFLQATFVHRSNKVSYDEYTSLTKISGDSLVTSRVKVMQGVNVLAGNESYKNLKVYASDEDITRIFSFETVDGSLGEFYTKEQAVILSSSMANKFFGTNQSTGKQIQIYTLGDTLSFTVAAVYKDYPRNSHEEFGSFIKFDSSSIQALGFNPKEGRALCKTASRK